MDGSNTEHLLNNSWPWEAIVRMFDTAEENTTEARKSWAEELVSALNRISFKYPQRFEFCRDQSTSPYRTWDQLILNKDIADIARDAFNPGWQEDQALLDELFTETDNMNEVLLNNNKNGENNSSL